METEMDDQETSSDDVDEQDSKHTSGHGPTSSYALPVTALGFGLASFLFFSIPWIPIAAIITGAIALSQTSRSAGALWWMGCAGTFLGVVYLAVFVYVNTAADSPAGGRSTLDTTWHLYQRDADIAQDRPRYYRVTEDGYKMIREVTQGGAGKVEWGWNPPDLCSAPPAPPERC
jgi:hypothetical protein